MLLRPRCLVIFIAQLYITSRKFTMWVLYNSATLWFLYYASYPFILHIIPFHIAHHSSSTLVLILCIIPFHIAHHSSSTLVPILCIIPLHNAHHSSSTRVPIMCIIPLHNVQHSFSQCTSYPFIMHIIPLHNAHHSSSTLALASILHITSNSTRDLSENINEGIGFWGGAPIFHLSSWGVGNGLDFAKYTNSYRGVIKQLMYMYVGCIQVLLLHRCSTEPGYEIFPGSGEADTCGCHTGWHWMVSASSQTVAMYNSTMVQTGIDGSWTN